MFLTAMARCVQDRKRPLKSTAEKPMAGLNGKPGRTWAPNYRGGIYRISLKKP